MTWITAGSGDWSTASNWSTNTVPAANDNVVINVTGMNVVVSYTDSAPLILNNLVNDELLVIGGGGVTWSGGTWDGSGVVDIQSTMDFSGSANKILKDGQAINNLGTMTLSGTGNIVGQVGASITNEIGATFLATSDADITFPAGSGDGIFENAGTFIKSGVGTTTEIGGAQGFSYENSINDTNAPQFSIQGDTQVLSGTLQLGDDQNTAITNGGSYEISPNATLDFNRGVHQIVVLRPPGGVPQVIPSITGPAGATGTDAGTLRVSGTANVQFYGTLAVHEIDVLNSGTLLLQQNMLEPNATSQQNTKPITAVGTADILSLADSGTFGGNGGGTFTAPKPENPPVKTEEAAALEVGTTFSWTGGSLSGAGRLLIDSTVSSTITTTTPKAINGGFGLDIFDQTFWQDSGTINMNGSSVIFIHSTATFWDQANGTLVQGNIDASGGSVWNMGNFEKSGGTGITTIGTGIDFINDLNPLNYVTSAVPVLQATMTEPVDLGGILLAKLNIDTGTVSLQGTSTNNDNILIAPSATLSYDGGSHFNRAYSNSNNVDNASILGHSNGTLNLGNATFNSDHNALIDVAHVTFGTGNYSFDNAAPGGTIFQTGVFNGGNSGTIGGAGVIEVNPNGGNGSFIWNTGTFSGTSANSALVIDANSILTIPSGNRSTASSYSIVNNGMIAWTTSPGLLTINGNYTQGSTGSLISNITGIPPAVDRLSVSGIITLNGALAVSLIGFTPVDGQKYTLINNTGAGVISGTFVGLTDGSTVTIGSSKFVVSYTGGDGNDLVLTAVVLPTINIVTPQPIAEGNSGTKSLVFNVTLSTSVTRNVSVNYATSNGTATAGQDYTATSGTLTIIAGRTTGTITVPIIGDMLVEANETFFMSLSNPVNGNLGNLAVATGTILNDDGPPVLSFSSATYSVSDTAGIATITVFNSNSSVPVTVQYSTAPGTAVAGTDYTPVSGTLTFATGVTSQTFNVPIIHDLTAETNSTFTVKLSNAQGGSASVGTSTAIVTIIDTNIPPPHISMADVTVTEPIYGQINAVFTLTVVNPSATSFTVDYTTIGGTAISGADFAAESGTITFQPNQTFAEILVPVNFDFNQEAGETFTVALSNPTDGAELDSTTATGTILNQTVNVVTLDAQHPYKFDDARGNVATIILQGPGSGTISYLGQPLDDSREIIIDNTTAQSSLIVRTTKAETWVVNLTVNGPLRAINGPNLGLLGDLNVTGGLQMLRLNSLDGGNNVNIGAAAGLFKNLTTVFNTVVDSTFTSALPIAALRVNSWQDFTSGADITAPSINTINCPGDFAADITLTGDLGNLTVGKNLTNSIIRVGGSINSITARTISDSSFFAGVSSDVTTLPSFSSQFSNTTSTINRVNVNSPASNAFSNTLIAAPNIGNLQLGLVAVSNGGTPFGVAGSAIRAVKIRNGQGIRVTNATLLNNPFTEIDMQIYLTTLNPL